MADLTTENPFSTRIIAVEMHKFDGSEYIDLRNQIVEFNIFESIFAPLVKVELAIIDQIGLFFNFPVTGEEYFKIIIERPAANDFEGVEHDERYFVVDYIDNIAPDDKAKQYSYRIGLLSIEAYVNAKSKISRAFQGTVSNTAEVVLQNYLIQPTADTFQDIYQSKNYQIQDTLDNRTFVCPMMNPLRFLNLLLKYSTPEVFASENHGAKYVFYENVDGFHFKSIESILTDDQLRTQAEREDKKYIYLADHTISDDTIVSQNKNQYRTITNLFINKRFSTLEKITGGYFENIFFEVNLMEKSLNVTGHQHKHNAAEAAKLDDYSLNTRQYIEQAQTIDDINLVNIAREDISNRTKIMFNNNYSGDYQYPVHTMKNVWGQQQETTVGLSQIDLTITVPGDSRLKVGELIYCQIPEIHGFTDVQEEQYVTGLFLITELKHLLTIGGKHTTVMRINKNSLFSDIQPRSIYSEAIRR